MRIRLTRSARRDVREGKIFYDKKENGLGDYFVDCIKADIQSLRFTAGVHAKKYKDYHRMVCHVFPFAIYYTNSREEVVIYGILDCRRDPAWIREQLSGQ